MPFAFDGCVPLDVVVLGPPPVELQLTTPLEAKIPVWTNGPNGTPLAVQFQ